MGAKIRAEKTQEAAPRAQRDADRAEGRACVAAHGGVRRTGAAVGQCLNGGLAFLEVECNRCETRELTARRDPTAAPHADLEARGLTQMPVLPQRPLRAACAHDPAHREAADRAVSVGSPERRALISSQRDISSPPCAAALLPVVLARGSARAASQSAPPS